jgi:hypothetical protein
MKSVDLIAGGGNPASAIDVGDVIVWNGFGYIYVKYVITEEGWYLTETHLAVAKELSGIPQTKKGNPIPGQFQYSTIHDPPVTEYTYTIPLTWDVDTTLYIAAHAKVVHITHVCTTIVSDTDVLWSSNGVNWQNTYACWVHPSWANIPGATWVWIEEYTRPAWEYDNVPEGGWYFKKPFTLPETAFNIKASVVAANGDNAYRIAINGIALDPEGEGAMNKDGPDHYEWSTIVQHTVPEGTINPGYNEIQLRALNYFNWGDAYSNPAGLIFKMELCYDYIDREETAWGAGTSFPGKNWATYFTYGVQPPVIIRYPETGNVYIGYEDWPNGDFDYNNFGMTFSATEIYEYGVSGQLYLTKVIMIFEAVIYDSGADHDIHITRKLNGDWVVTVERTATAYGHETPAGTYSGSGDVDVILFDTSKYSWPMKKSGDAVTVTIKVLNPELNPLTHLEPPRTIELPDGTKIIDVDPFMANYDPWMRAYLPFSPWKVDWHIYSVMHVTGVSGAYSYLLDERLIGLNLPHILVVPKTDWIPPYEDTCISRPFDQYQTPNGDWDGPYNYFYDYYSTGSPANWYETITNSYVGRGGISWAPGDP